MEFMEELLCLIELGCSGVPNEETGECIYKRKDTRVEILPWILLNSKSCWSFDSLKTFSFSMYLGLEVGEVVP